MLITYTTNLAGNFGEHSSLRIFFLGIIKILVGHTNIYFRVCSVFLGGLNGILRALFALVRDANKPENLGKFTSGPIIYMQTRCVFWGGVGS